MATRSGNPARFMWPGGVHSFSHTGTNSDIQCCVVENAPCAGASIHSNHCWYTQHECHFKCSTSIRRDDHSGTEAQTRRERGPGCSKCYQCHSVSKILFLVAHRGICQQHSETAQQAVWVDHVTSWFQPQQWDSGFIAHHQATTW